METQTDDVVEREAEQQQEEQASKQATKYGAAGKIWQLRRSRKKLGSDYYGGCGTVPSRHGRELFWSRPVIELSYSHSGKHHHSQGVMGTQSVLLLLLFSLHYTYSFYSV